MCKCVTGIAAPSDACSHLATWLTTGAKLVGPYSWTVLRLWWYASNIPSIPLQYGFSMFPFWEIRAATKKRLEPTLFRKQPQAKTGGQLHQRELVGHPSIGGQFCPKAQSREHLVAVVVLNDLPDGLQRHGVSVQLVGVHVVQRGWLWWVTCGPFKVNVGESCDRKLSPCSELEINQQWEVSVIYRSLIDHYQMHIWESAGGV